MTKKSDDIRMATVPSVTNLTDTREHDYICCLLKMMKRKMCNIIFTVNCGAKQRNCI